VPPRYCYRARREELRFQLALVAFAGVFTVALASLVAAVFRQSSTS
jgi:hypothetical protein